MAFADELIVFDYFVGLALKGLTVETLLQLSFFFKNIEVFKEIRKTAHLWGKVFLEFQELRP